MWIYYRRRDGFAEFTKILVAFSNFWVPKCSSPLFTTKLSWRTAVHWIDFGAFCIWENNTHKSTNQCFIAKNEEIANLILMSTLKVWFKDTDNRELLLSLPIFLVPGGTKLLSPQHNESNNHTFFWLICSVVLATKTKSLHLLHFLSTSFKPSTALHFAKKYAAILQIP